MDTAQENTARRALVDKLLALGTEATKPGMDAAIQESNVREFDRFVNSTGTSDLIQTLTFLIQPGKVPPQLRVLFMDVLTRIPLRPDGVRATSEFVFSVHPSSVLTASEAATPQKNGANITQGALNMAAKMIAYPPSSVPQDTWYRTIAPQLFTLLDGKDGQELMKVASYVIGFGILGRRQAGAPGTAGWKAIAEPILGAINPTSDADSWRNALEREDDDIVDLSRPAVLVTATELAQALYRLQALLISHPNPTLSRRLLSRVVLPLWALASWTSLPSQSHEKFCQPSQNLLKIYLKIAAEPTELQKVIRNLSYKGSLAADRQWRFEATSSGDICIVKPKTYQNEAGDLGWDEIDPKANCLIDLVKSVYSEDDISTIFTNLFSTWFSANSNKAEVNLSADRNEDSSDPMSLLAQINVLQKMMEAFPSQLASRPGSILRLVEPILKQASNVEEDDTVPVALSLLNLVVTAPGFQKASVDGALMPSIEASLDHLSRGNLGDASATARNLSLLLKYRDELEDPSDTVTGPTDRQIEDRKTYRLALSYITQADSPPPVRAEGINLLQLLITANSPALDIPATLTLMSSLLQDNEDYINLKVIKVFTQLAHKHPKAVTKELLEHYVDANEVQTVDCRLRFGEALLQVIERLGEMFTRETAQQVAEALLSTAGRRGYRPKTEKRQKKDEQLRLMKEKKAEREWGGSVPDLGDDEDEETEKDKVNKELLTQIVSGWDSKKGAEDVRVRASALSIFAVGIETNLVGIGPTLITAAVDLSANILTMEPGVEMGILRRSAVLVILSFVRALHKARELGKRVGFGLTEESQADIKRVLTYVSETDNDGLVRQHAEDVIESLDNWKLGLLVSQATTPDPALSRLAGLSVGPSGASMTTQMEARPKIEEIE